MGQTAPVSTQWRPSDDEVCFDDSNAFLRSLVAGQVGVDRAASVALAARDADGWRELTYAELDRHCSAVHALLARAGVVAGDRVIIQDDPSPAWVAVLLGVWRAGGIAVPVDPHVTDAEMRPTTARCNPALVIVDAAQSVADAQLAGTPPSAVTRRMSDPALIVWTSGTTGTPKGVTLTFDNVAYDVRSAVVTQRLAPADRWLSVLPLHHMLELSCALLSSLTCGAELSFAQTLFPAEIVGLMQERRTTHLMTVPLLLRLLRPAIARSDVRPRVLFVGGAPLPSGTIEAYAELGIPVYQGYGLTETSPLISANSPDHDRPGSVGRPLPGTEIRVDATGELQVRSPAVMAGYWEDDASTDAVVIDGWFVTGDLGFVDAEGFVHVTGRAKNLIVLESGKKVQPEEVETALHASPLFAEVCVVGVPSHRDRDSGAQEVCAVVVPCSTMSDDEAAAEVTRVSGGLSSHKRPTAVVVADDELPKTAKRSIVRPAVVAMATSRRTAP